MPGFRAWYVFCPIPKSFLFFPIQLGIPAIGFSPIINTPILLHDHNEFLNERVYLEGIRLYTKIIPRLANLPKSSGK
jgi:hypothetical protein